MMRYHSLSDRKGYPWERCRIYAEASPEKIREELNFVMGNKREPSEEVNHAYTGKQLKEIRGLLKLSEMSDEFLNRHLDEFVILLGVQLSIEPEVSPKDCIDRLNQEIIRPLETLSSDLDKFRMRCEFAVPWGALRDFDLIEFESEIETLIALTKKQIERHKSRSVKGREPETLIKDYYVQTVDALASYLQPAFDPRKRKGFLGLVTLLAGPLFPSKTNFTTAVRRHVDNWSQEFNQMCQEVSKQSEC